ncbi:MAG TPA: biopolymer transporter ExbD [Gemmataceae bacterium]|jgi:biopolymer transport protein ExbD|nr:biopolymer transporter ExbD [Gemmataceae bacterium]
MSWRIRHEGSPVAIDGLTQEQVLEGLRDGRWEPTDEVMGPDDPAWVAIENHPALAEVAAELEPPPPRVYDDETRLDMTPLIDVTLVLLIFFILTTSYAALQKLMESARLTTDEKTGAIVYTPEQVKQSMIHVKVTMKGDQPIYSVEGREVDEDGLLPALRGFTREKTTLLIESDPDVPRKAVVTLQDEAKAVGIDKINFLLKK